MANRRDDGQAADITEQLAPLVEDDSFLSELSRGVDPSAGADPLAALLLELREEVEAPMPAAPLIEGAALDPEIISLDAARTRRRVNPLTTGLIGLAAGIALMAGSGAVLYQSGPDSPLHGARSAIFGPDNGHVVELATALEEMESKAAAGDYTGARALLDKARQQLDDASPEDLQKLDKAEQSINQREAATRTVTVTETMPAPSPAGQGNADGSGAAANVVTTTVVQQPTVTVGVTTTVVVTDPGHAENPVPTPTSSAPQPEETDTAAAMARDPQLGTSPGGANTGGTRTKVAAAMADESEYKQYTTQTKPADESAWHGEEVRDLDGDGLPDAQ